MAGGNELYHLMAEISYRAESGTLICGIHICSGRKSLCVFQKQIQMSKTFGLLVTIYHNNIS